MQILPRKHNRKESQVDSLVAKGVEKHLARPYVLEVKLQGNKLLPHQDKALQMVAEGKMPPLKIPDMGRRNPFDYIGGFEFMEPVLCTVDGRKVTCEIYTRNYTFNFRI